MRARRRDPVASKALCRPFLRFWGLLLLTALALLQVLPAVHFAAVAHVVCEEHGQLHHEDEVGTTSAESPRAQGPSVSAGAESAHGHDDCGVVAATAERVTLARSDSTSRVPAEIGASISAKEFARAKSSLALLSYAPKLAPPV